MIDAADRWMTYARPELNASYGGQYLSCLTLTQGQSVVIGAPKLSANCQLDFIVIGSDKIGSSTRLRIPSRRPMASMAVISLLSL